MTGKKPKKPISIIIEGMNACYGSDERDCSRCPYDRYNERDFYGQSTSYCMEKLNEDAKKWTESMTMFTNCGDCCCYKDGNENEFDHHPEKEGKSGWCGYWRTTFCPDEFCCRGAQKYDY